MSLKFDAQLTALGSVQRRQLLAELLAAGTDGTITVDAFVDRIAEDTRQASIQLYHVHVPLLAELGIITTVNGGASVRRGDAFEELRPLLELLVTHGERWPGALDTTHESVSAK